MRRATSEAQRVKVVGIGHSFTDIAATPPGGRMVSLDGYDRVLGVDRSSGRVTVQAGVTIASLNQALDAHGLALPNLGDIAYQTISGAIATATHGTGVTLGGIATQVVGMEIVAGDGTVLRCSADSPGSQGEDVELLRVARVGLGALGVVSNLTLQCVPAFNLHVVESGMGLDRLLESLDDLVDRNDHFEFFWMPHTGAALAKRNNRTDEPVRRRSRREAFVDDILGENLGFGALCRLGRARPAWIPRLNRVTVGGGGRDSVEPSHEVFASRRWVRFTEMEYSLPRTAAADALRSVRSFIDSSGLRIGFPVEVRFTAGDDIPLSTAYGGERAYVAVHVYKGMPWEQYFRGVEAIMRELGGRPHWGKLHYRSAADLAPAYPEWDRFVAMRRRIDPTGTFANAYLDRVLGPVA